MKENTTVIIIVTLLAIHFLAGIGWLLYKVMRAKPTKKDEE
ncbi:hypothetical protein [Algoriphagus sp. AK58]|nr:hypothetical protein [Algoriphagus sp. AK58]